MSRPTKKMSVGAPMSPNSLTNNVSISCKLFISHRRLSCIGHLSNQHWFHLSSLTFTLVKTMKKKPFSLLISPFFFWLLRVRTRVSGGSSCDDLIIGARLEDKKFYMIVVSIVKQTGWCFLYLYWGALNWECSCYDTIHLVWSASCRLQSP